MEKDNIFNRALKKEKEKRVTEDQPIVEQPIVESTKVETVDPNPTKVVEPKRKFNFFSRRKTTTKTEPSDNTTSDIKSDDTNSDVQDSSEFFVNTFHDPNIIELKSESQKYEKVNIIDLVNIHQEYNVILSAPPGKTDSPNNGSKKSSSMFISPSTPKPIAGKNVVFDNFNLSVKDIVNRGQFVSILGKSGCGKSTLLRYICGLQKPTSGEIYLHGKKLKEEDRIPMVFQQYSSFPWKSVLQNVALPLILKGVSKNEAYDKAMEMIKIVGLDGQQSKFAKYPILSGGQLQRVAIARNLVADPRILLMDEPFGALDIITRRSMQVFLRKIFQDNNGVDPTVLLVTHDIREAIFLSSDIYILDANPANVRCHIEIDLPNERKISLKRDPKFLEYVDYVEDFLEKIENEKK